MSEPSEQSKRIQKVIECDVCLNYFDLGTRKPKNLSCGHTFCLICLENVQERNNIQCPSCRASTAVVHGRVGDLPTNFSSLSLLESLCEECRNQPWAARCSHCPKKLCKDCSKTHPEGAPSISSAELELLKTRISELEQQSQATTELPRIRQKGDAIIEDIKITYNSHINKAEKHRDEMIDQVKYVINTDIQESLSWKGKLESELSSAKRLLNEITLSYDTAISSQYMTEIEARCTQALAHLNEAWASKPTTTTITFHTPDQISTIHEIGQLIVTEKSQALSKQPQKLIPNYKACSIKTVFDIKGIDINQMVPSFITQCSITGNVIITEIMNNTVHILDSNLQVITQFGSHGNLDGQFRRPKGVAVSQQKQIFIADDGNNRIQVTDENGRFIRHINGNRLKKVQFSQPDGLAFDENNHLYICNYGTNRILVITEDGSFVRSWGSKCPNTGQFRSPPRSICITPNGRVIVTDYGYSLYIFTTDGSHIKTIHPNTPPQNIKATHVATDKYNNIIITDQRGYIVVLTEDGEVICTLLKKQNGSGEMKDPKGVTVTRSGDILVCDWGNHSILSLEVPKDSV